MKILSPPEGEGLLTNVEVNTWLKEKNFDINKREVKPDQIRPPTSTASLARDLRTYLDSSPAGHETVSSVKSLYSKLEKFHLSPLELLMIVNIRPSAYAQLTPLIMHASSRFDDDQLYEILQLIDSTLEKRPPPIDPGADDTAADEDAGNAAGKGKGNDVAETTQRMAQANVNASG